MQQRVLSGKDKYDELRKWLTGKRVLVVCGSAYPHIKRTKEILDGHADTVYFDHYKPNPVYESVVEGVELFAKEKCDALMAVGGGSAIDVAKCIKLYSGMDTGFSFMEQQTIANDIPFMVVPTTAGTGSETTRYAVIYLNGEKQSVTSDSIIPATVLLDPDNLSSLPEYQRKATMMDTFAHALESMWSVNSTPESMEYSKEALRLFTDNMEGYLNNTTEGNSGMQMAAFIAGKAINITQTTAGHAMCYKITGMFGCAHGHAAMMVNRKLFPWMINHIGECCDPRGVTHLQEAFMQISRAMGRINEVSAADKIESIYRSLDMTVPSPDEEQLDMLVNSVNLARLGNTPVALKDNDLKLLYKQVFEQD